ncbi:uncharacterized protein A1O5_13449 [Cladophialophora psammophila CBS 110553]|uniref:3-oxoacyl-[acyl-carrier protein] reductase n=1 Tax=Cladophialophora psammophila CBS 110553 TaxID=1182543 RepID=W9VCL6_9EURO|nr:uncharacterized protein A1O5_13449 [Cladophialophora psammophila CBS 110553]EXJ53327.1 hypothetical protein A1O5_13449 [Cladophialophora psammophila CBS 110553]
MADQVVLARTDSCQSIVTGAGNGIGLAMVKQLLASQKVSHVVAVDLNVEKLEKLRHDHAQKLFLVSGDVSQSSTSAQAVQTALDKAGRINTLILNAAIVKPIGPFPQLALADWKKAFDVNFFALIDMIQHAWPYLLKSEGNILLTSTRVCLKPTESWTCYACTKSVLNYLCSCLPLEEPRIKALAISPGAVDTDSMAGARNDAMQKFLGGIQAGGKLLRPEQPASAFVKIVETGIPQELTGSTINWDKVPGAMLL